MHLIIHEDVVIFYSKQPAYNKQFRKGQPYINKRNGIDDTGDCYGKIKVRTDTKNNGERNPISLLDFSREVGRHPTQKPVSLMEYLIKTYTNKHELVLDFTIGSGTTAVAALNTHRNFIGIEISEEYCKIARQRISQAEPQLF